MVLGSKINAACTRVNLCACVALYELFFGNLRKSVLLFELNRFEHGVMGHM